MRRSKRAKAAQAAPGPQEPSLWQEPPAFFVTVLERLLAMPDGTKHVRLASHVCHHWRVAALEVLLADTAISKPPMEDFRAIGQQHPLLPAKCHKQETVTTQAAVVLEASASTGMEAISKQRFDGPPGALAPAVGAAGRGRSRSGRPAQAAGARAGAALAPVAAQQQQQQQPSPHRLLLQQAAAAQLALGAAQQQQAQQQLSPHRQLLQQAAAAQLALGAAQQRQQAPQAQQQASAGPGSTVPAAAAHAAGASPSAQQPGEADVPQGSIHSGMATIGRRRTAALESESEGGSTRARGPNKRRRARRGSELSGGRGMSVEQPLRQPPPQQAQQVQQQAAGHAARAASGQHAAAQGATAEAAGTSRPSSRRRRRSVSTAGTEVEGRPSKRQQTSEARRPQRAGLRSSGPASGDGLPDTQHPRSQQHAQQAQQAQEQQQQQQAQQGAQASGRQRRRSRQPRSEQLTMAQQAQKAQQGQRPTEEQAQPVQPAGGKLADPFAASGSYHELAEGGAEVEQQVPQLGGKDGDNSGPWERSRGAEGGLQAAINVVWRFLRLRE